MPVKKAVQEPKEETRAKQKPKRKTMSVKTSPTAMNVPASLVFPKIPVAYWICFYTGLILAFSLLYTCITAPELGPLGYERAGFFSYLISILAPGGFSIFALISKGRLLFPFSALAPRVFAILWIIALFLHVIFLIWVTIQVIHDEVPAHPVASITALWSIITIALVILIVVGSAIQNSGKKRRR